jgi:hypothetical protein
MADLKNIFKDKDMVTTVIALFLLVTFITIMIALFFFNWYLVEKSQTIPEALLNNIPAETLKDWFELFKSMIILLGTTLTTIIGYYFGQREAKEARKEAEDAKINANKTVEEARKEVEDARMIVNKTVEESLEKDKSMQIEKKNIQEALDKIRNNTFEMAEVVAKDDSDPDIRVASRRKK